MATKLFDNIIFGPINSRRLGVSLGVNLLPITAKLCNFDCIYCECGWTERSAEKLRFNSREHVQEMLEKELLDMSSREAHLDVITFAGNGEPTMHPDFAAIIDDTIALRNKYYPLAKVAVLSNSTMLGKDSVRDALAKVDRAILKIDSAIDNTIKIVNGPKYAYSLDKVIENMQKFKGELIIQTMFLRGEHNNQYIDNTSPEEVSAWMDVLDKVHPKLVMIYSIDRDTPSDLIEQVSYEEMKQIALLVEARGYECIVSS